MDRRTEITNQIKALLDELVTLQTPEALEFTPFRITGGFRWTEAAREAARGAADVLGTAGDEVPFELALDTPEVLVLAETRDIRKEYGLMGEIVELIPGDTTTWFAIRGVTRAQAVAAK